MILVALAALVVSPLLSASTTIVAVSRTTVVRVTAKRPRTPAPPLQTYREKKGPKCVYAADISAAAVTGPDAVDLAIRGGNRVRAKLEEECPALDFYRGFYISPSADGKICADRDVIRTRSGGECMIDRFRTLLPQDPPKAP